MLARLISLGSALTEVVQVSAERIRVGLVGCGNAGRNIHMRLLREHADLYEVVVCADVSQDAAGKLAADFGIRAADGVARLVEDGDVELVVVATKPPVTHRDVAVLASGRGKHVVVEKPMADNEAQCTEMIEAAAAAGRVLAVHHNRRWDIDFMAARHAIESGAVGQPRLVRNEYLAAYSGSPYDWGIHLVDQTMCLSLGKTFVELSATFCSPADAAGFFTCRLRTEDDVVHDLSMLPSVTGNALRPGRMPYRFMVAGTKGVLYQDWCQRPADAVAKTTAFQPVEGGAGLGDLPQVSAALAVPDFYEMLHRSIRNGAPAPVSGEDGRRAVKAWELIGRSASQGKTLAVEL